MTVTMTVTMAEVGTVSRTPAAAERFGGTAGVAQLEQHATAASRRSCSRSIGAEITARRWHSTAHRVPVLEEGAVHRVLVPGATHRVPVPEEGAAQKVPVRGGHAQCPSSAEWGG